MDVQTVERSLQSLVERLVRRTHVRHAGLVVETGDGRVRAAAAAGIADPGGGR